MKWLLGFVAALFILLDASAATGQVNFSTRSPAMGVDVPVTLQSTGEGPGPDYVAGLCVVTPAGVKLIPESVSQFRSGTQQHPAIARYIFAKTVAIPGSNVGDNVTLRIRVWRAADGSFEKAPEGKKGESADFIINSISGGTSVPSNLPKNLAGFVIKDLPGK